MPIHHHVLVFGHDVKGGNICDSFIHKNTYDITHVRALLGPNMRPQALRVDTIFTTICVHYGAIIKMPPFY